jgi:mannose-6-phosphate isomerase-like protein (cupin superfamily)
VTATEPRTGYFVRPAAEAPTVPCPCGQSTRIVTAADGYGCSFHITHIYDSVRHYHRKTTELYYVLEGSGQMELNGETVEVRPGLVIGIEPGTRHRLVSAGGVRTIVFGIPAFDPADEFFD